jgi:hypothetical protein
MLQLFPMVSSGNALNTSFCSDECFSQKFATPTHSKNNFLPQLEKSPARSPAKSFCLSSSRKSSEELFLWDDQSEGNLSTDELKLILDSLVTKIEML